MKLRFQFKAAAVLLFTCAYLNPASHGAIQGVTMPPEDGKLRVVVFGAHPDDCEIQTGGTAAMWAKKGHHVLLVSLTNGDIGHWKEAGGPLALRRRDEVKRAHQLLGVQGVILDNHDGELMPSLENRRAITRLIREWKADLVISHRPNDYHPDHRYTGVLVQDAAYMVTVPFFCPDVPPLKKNPVFFYSGDNFQKPNPFDPEVVVALDPIMDTKLDALGVMISQFAEGGANGDETLMPVNDPEKQNARKQQVRSNFMRRQQGIADRFRSRLEEWYPTTGAKVKYAEAFEVCEYGSRPGKEELKRLFPFGE